MPGILSRSEMEVLDSIHAHDGEIKRIDSTWKDLTDNYKQPVKALGIKGMIEYRGIFVSITDRGRRAYKEMKDKGRYE